MAPKIRLGLNQGEGGGRKGNEERYRKEKYVPLDMQLEAEIPLENPKIQKMLADPTGFLENLKHTTLIDRGEKAHSRLPSVEDFEEYDVSAVKTLTIEGENGEPKKMVVKRVNRRLHPENDLEEYDLARKAYEAGIPTAKPLGYLRDKGNTYLFFEHLSGKTLYEMTDLHEMPQEVREQLAQEARIYREQKERLDQIEARLKELREQVKQMEQQADPKLTEERARVGNDVTDRVRRVVENIDQLNDTSLSKGKQKQVSQLVEGGVRSLKKRLLKDAFTSTEARRNTALTEVSQAIEEELNIHLPIESLEDARNTPDEALIASWIQMVTDRLAGVGEEERKGFLQRLDNITDRFAVPFETWQEAKKEQWNLEREKGQIEYRIKKTAPLEADLASFIANAEQKMKKLGIDHPDWSSLNILVQTDPETGENQFFFIDWEPRPDQEEGT